MKLEEKYTNLKYLETEEGFIRGRKPVPCAICKEYTLFIDLCSEEPFCSEECIANYYRNIDF